MREDARTVKHSPVPYSPLGERGRYMAEDYVSVVNDIISVCKDAEQGFRGAAGAVKNPTLQNIFEQYAEQRAGFARQLQQALAESGNEPEKPSGAAGKVHSAWITLKGVLTGHSEHQILIEAERGEDHSLNTYQDALSTTLPPAIRTLVDNQFTQVQQAHNRIRNLRDTTDREPVPSR